MTAPSPQDTPKKIELPIRAIQPGGGWGMTLELFWGKLRRFILRATSPGYVKRMKEARQGSCADCPGKPLGCTGEVVDCRDLKYFRNVCGYHFPLEQDRFRYRDRIPFARYGLSELISITFLSILISMAFSSLLRFNVPIWVVSILLFAIFLVWLEVVWFFRNPRRQVKDDPTLIISPCDGKIVDMDEVNFPEFPEGKALRIGVFLSIFNVHVNRIPRSGTVTKMQYFQGKFLNAMDPTSKTENEQLWIDIKDEATGHTIQLRQIAGAIARRIVCDLKPGQTVKAGDIFGMIKLGSRAELYVPVSWKPEWLVKVGDTIQGGSTVLGKL